MAENEVIFANWGRFYSYCIYGKTLLMWTVGESKFIKDKGKTSKSNDEQEYLKLSKSFIS